MRCPHCQREITEPRVSAAMLTPAQSKLLTFMGAFAAEKGFMPSQREMATAIGLASASGVNRILNELVERGRIRRLRERSRAYEIVGLA